MPSRLSVGVIGAGLSGLSAAWHLVRQGHSVRVFEADTVAGGVVRTERSDGFLAELGPNSMVMSPLVNSLVTDLGLEARRLPVSRSMSRYIVRHGAPLRVPTGLRSLLTTPLFTARAKLQLLLEPFQARRVEAAEESLAGLIRRRLGQEFIDYALDPVVGGVFAGDSERLSVAYALPRLAALETRHGSLVRAALAKLRERKSTNGAGEAGQSFSFRDGLAEIPLAIGGLLGTRLSLGTRVLGIHRLGPRWMLEAAAGTTRARAEFDAVICTVPAHALPELEFSGEHGEALAALGEIRYAPVAAVVLGFRRDCVSHPLDGFGLLVPPVERFHSLGTLFSSSLFAGRAPEDHVLLSTFVGGMRNPDLAAASEPAMASMVLADLQHLLGVRGQPVFVRSRRWRHAIPQYELGYSRFRTLIEEVETANSGFLLAGNYRGGISVADTMTSGYAAAETLVQRGRHDTAREIASSR